MSGETWAVGAEPFTTQTAATAGLDLDLRVEVTGCQPTPLLSGPEAPGNEAGQ